MLPASLSLLHVQQTTHTELTLSVYTWNLKFLPNQIVVLERKINILAVWFLGLCTGHSWLLKNSAGKGCIVNVPVLKGIYNVFIFLQMFEYVF